MSMHRGSWLCFSMSCLLKSSHCLAMPFPLVSFRVASPPFHIKAGRLRSALCRRDAMWLVSHRCHAVASPHLSFPFHVQASDICSLLIPAIAGHIVSSLTARSLSIADPFASYQLKQFPGCSRHIRTVQCVAISQRVSAAVFAAMPRHAISAMPCHTSPRHAISATCVSSPCHAMPFQFFSWTGFSFRFRSSSAHVWSGPLRCSSPTIYS